MRERKPRKSRVVSSRAPASLEDATFKLQGLTDTIGDARHRYERGDADRFHACLKKARSRLTALTRILERKSLGGLG